MQKRRLGQGLEVSAIGLGCMSMSSVYGKSDDGEAVAALEKALELDITFIDTADAYGFGQNETLIGPTIRRHRDRIVLASKFGNIRTPEGKLSVNGRPDYVRQACDASLKRLGVETIDLYYQHRVDPDVPIEDTIGAMAGLVKAGKVRHLGMSEAAARTVRRAAAVHPIAALQSEYSLWCREVEAEILPACRELGIGFVPYSPLGRGFLTGAYGSADQLASDDRRREHPRFAAENYAKNERLLGVLKEIAAARSATPAQIALAWLLAQGEDIVPIPGTKHAVRVVENTQAVELELSRDDLARLDSAFPVGVTAGARYPEAQLGRVGL